MQTYTGSWGQRIACGLFGFGTLGWCLGMSAWKVGEPRISAWEQGLSVAFLLTFFLPTALYMLRSFLEACAVYRLDGEGIRKRILWREQIFYWRNLSDYRAGYGESGYALHDGAGGWLDIYLGLMRSQERTAFHAALQPYLQRIDPARQSSFAVGREYDSGVRWAIMVVLPISILFIVIGLALPFLLSDDIGKHASVVFDVAVIILGVLLLTGLGGLMLYVGLARLTRMITVTDSSVAQRDLFRRKSFAFSDIHRLDYFEAVEKGRPVAILTLHSGRQRIRLTSQMLDFALVRDHIRTHANRAEWQDKTRKNDPVRQERAKKQDRLFLAGLTAFMTILCGFYLHRGYQRVALANTLQKDGRQTIGVVSRTESSTAKTTTYYVYYDYGVNGRAYQGRSQILWRDYQELRRGAPLSLVYLPSAPAQSAFVHANDRRVGIGDMLMGAFGIAATIIFLAWTLWTMKKEKIPD